ASRPCSTAPGKASTKARPCPRTPFGRRCANERKSERRPRARENRANEGDESKQKPPRRLLVRLQASWRFVVAGGARPFRYRLARCSSTSVRIRSPSRATSNGFLKASLKP